MATSSGIFANFSWNAGCRGVYRYVVLRGVKKIERISKSCSLVR